MNKRTFFTEWGSHLWHEEKRDFATACWIWSGFKDRLGYGKIGKLSPICTASTLAHRESYVRAMGPVPHGLELDHLCRQPSCVRPDHLEAVAHVVNMRRGRRSRMTPDVLAQIFELRKRGLTLQQIAEKVGFNRTTVGDVVAGRRWN